MKFMWSFKNSSEKSFGRLGSPCWRDLILRSNCLQAISVFATLRYQCVQWPYCWCVTSGGDHLYGLDSLYLSLQLVYGILNGFNITGKSHILNQNIQISTANANVELISLKAKSLGELSGSWLIYCCYILIIYKINKYTLVISS